MKRHIGHALRVNARALLRLCYLTCDIGARRRPKLGMLWQAALHAFILRSWNARLLQLLRGTLRIYRNINDASVAGTHYALDCR